jgi:hypothetical protein
MRPTHSSGTFIDEKNELYLYQPNSNRIDLYNLRTGAKVGEIVHNSGERFQTLAWVRDGEVAGFCKSSGKVRIMTYLGSERQVVEAGRLHPFQAGAYDCEHHVFFAVGADGKARNYCREAWPYALATPTFTPAEVYGLKGNLVRTRLQGQDGEPCPDWWVHWELEGVGEDPVLGHLDVPVSKTDKDGWAENLYLGPVEGLSGQNKLKVRVVLS